jgi:hypothetical protein
MTRFVGPGAVSTGRLRSATGQATVEVVALVPLLVAVALAAFTVLAAGRASAAAESAAEAGAIALVQGHDGAAAARAALGTREGTAVRIRGGRVRVSVRPPVPFLADRLTAVAEADSGAAPPPSPLHLLRGGDGLSGAPPAPAVAPRADAGS